METKYTKLSFDKETGKLTKEDGTLVCTMNKELIGADPLLVESVVHAPEAVVLLSRAMLQLIVLGVLSPQTLPEETRKEIKALTEDFNQVFKDVPPAPFTETKTVVFD